ncbi:mucin-21-like isoform X2 [Eublepharis macularius]|uniref:Mucin-21-like isoform X2 n=1 Tax=Eublepharis macularius TaxID=481883 RepID=A0AA97K983_EUBMA|nr:mucin-21-like isoform X2 [Eublepharis macularius]
METSRSLLRQVTGYSMFFVFLILFASGILGEKNATLPSQESATASPAVVSTNDTIPTKKMIAKDTGSDVSSEASTVSKLLVATSSNKETPSKSTMSVEQPSTIKPTDTVAERKEPVTLKQTKQATSTPVVHVSATPEATTEVAATPAEMKTTKVGHKTNTTVTVLTASNKTATTVKSTGQIPRSSKGKKEMNTTTPGQHVQADHTTHANTSSKRTESQSTTVTSIIKASEADVGKTESPSKGSGGVTGTSIIETSESYPKMTASSSKGVTVAIVLSVLLVLVLLIALLFCWRRRRSGSTSFNSAGWAGQAALPDDSGLDKELSRFPTFLTRKKYTTNRRPQ